VTTNQTAASSTPTAQQREWIARDQLRAAVLRRRSSEEADASAAAYAWELEYCDDLTDQAARDLVRALDDQRAGRELLPGAEIPAPPPALAAVLAEVAAERRRQDERWGEQNHDDGTGTERGAFVARVLRRACDRRHAEGVGTWADILAEEVGEAFGESDPAALRTELVQVAAVAVAWAGAIDRRQGRPA
jgi:hypothetical protein